jgi:hypothetical protein
MRQFEKELVEDRQFTIGGELFEWRYPFWEDFAARRDQDAAIITKEPEKNEDGTDKVDETTFKDLYKDFIDRIEPFIDPKHEGIKRWRALSKRKEDPVPAYQYTELYMWLLEVTSARPTETLLSSSNGQERTEATSTEGSSSPATTP